MLFNYSDFIKESEINMIKIIAVSYLRENTKAYENEDGTWSCDTDLAL